jgi:glycosyltransferase involved in cell wall biosynthesis
VVHVTTTAEFTRLILWSDLRRLAAITDQTVACADGPEVAGLRHDGVRVLTIPIRRKLAPIADLRAIVALWRVLRRERFDLLHSYVPKGGLVGQIAGWLAGVPRRVHTWHGLLYAPTMPAWQRVVLPITDRIINRLAHRVLFISEADREAALGRRLCRPDRSRLVGTGVDLARFAPDAVPPGTRARVRRELGIPPDAFLVLTVGRYVADKGFRELAEAAAMLARADVAAHFVWIAPVFEGEQGVLPDALAQRADTVGSITRLGMQDDVRPFYAAADVLALPSYREGVPKVLIEAAAMGLPIVASDIPGCRQVIRSDDTGLLVPPADARALADALMGVRTNPDQARRRAEAARRDAVDRFDDAGPVERIQAVYRELLPGS